MSCSSMATATQYTTIATSTVLTSSSYIVSSLPAGTTILTSSICVPEPSGGTTATVSCRTFTAVSSLGGGATTVQVPIVVTVTTTSVSPLSTLYSTTCSSTRTAANQQTTAQITVSTTTVRAVTPSTTSHRRSSAVTTAIHSSVATSAAANAGSSSSDNTGVIVGAAVGGGIGLILVILLGWFLCHKRPRDKGEYVRGDKSSQGQGQFDGNAMVRPTGVPYPYRDHSEGSDYFSAHPGRPRSYRNLKTIPAFGFSSPQAQSPFATPPPQTAVLVSREQLGSRSISSSGENASVPETAVRMASVGRPHARRVASEGIGIPSPSNPPQRGRQLPSGEVVGLVRSPPLPEKDRFYLHPDWGLTIMPCGVEAASSGPSAQGGAPSRDGVLDSERRQEPRVRGGGETGGQGAVPYRTKGRDQQKIGGKRQLASAGMAREKRRLLDEHGGEESEGEAPPAYWE